MNNKHKHLLFFGSLIALYDAAPVYIAIRGALQSAMVWGVREPRGAVVGGAAKGLPEHMTDRSAILTAYSP